MRSGLSRWAVSLVALALIGLSVWMLERGRAGLDITELAVGTTPATLYQKPGTGGPLVVVAHGFAGSRQLMQAYSLTLAQSGYAVLAFDFEGHGRNPQPMSGDVGSIDGTTKRLVDETLRVLQAGRGLPGVGPGVGPGLGSGLGSGVALLGHSMATDIIARAAIADGGVDAVVGISMFSQAVTATEPARLLIISGEWEGMLRAAALKAVQLVKPDAVEGETVTTNGVTRRAVVAPNVEHVAVLFSGTAIEAARDWLDRAFGRTSTGPIVKPGLWILVLLSGIVVLFWPLVGVLPAFPKGAEGPQVSNGRFWLAILLPSVVVPLVATTFYVRFLPVLVADYLMIHLALFGVLQLALLRVWPLPRWSGVAVLALVVWGIAVFGIAIDRYAASFLPTTQRLGIIAALAVGCVPFMVADACVTGAGRGVWWRRIVARVAMLASLVGAAFLDLDRLMFVLIFVPVILLFFLVLGPMGRWVGRQSGAVSAGLGLGVILAWALGVSFPMFVAG